MRVATEADIRRHATRLYEAAAATTPRLFDRKWWTGRLLDWAIRDETFKVQLFRFIDVLPTLKTPSQIKRLVDEYFGQDAGLRDAPGGRSLMRWGMRALSTVGFGVGVTADTIYNQAIQMANQVHRGRRYEGGASGCRRPLETRNRALGGPPRRGDGV